MEEKIVCNMRVQKRDEAGNKINEYEVKKIECDKIKIFVQKGKATVDETEIIDSIFVHYRDHKGRPVQLSLKDNPAVTRKIREVIQAEFGQLKIKAEGNLASFDGFPCVEFVVTADASCHERNRFKQFSYARCEPGIWKFTPIERQQKPKIRRLSPEEIVVVETVEEKLQKSFGKLKDKCPQLAEIKIDHQKVAEELNRR